MIQITDWLASQHTLFSNSETLESNDLKLLLCHLLAKNSAWLYAHQDYYLNPDQLKQLDVWVKELKEGKPLAYITGEKAFWNLNLKVNAHTLIPRPETELIIETVQQLNLNPRVILDLGTGSGAIALALATLYPAAEIMATDISIEALHIAEENANRHQISNVELLQSDWFSNVKRGDFELIVSNPPYIAANDEHLNRLTHEPMTALVAENHGLADYQKICASAKNYLQQGGILMFEHGWQQHAAVAEIMKTHGFIHISHAKDLLGHQRITWGIS